MQKVIPVLVVIAIIFAGCFGVDGEPFHPTLERMADEAEAARAVDIQERYEHGFVDGCMSSILVFSPNPGTYDSALAQCQWVYEMAEAGEFEEEGIPSEIIVPQKEEPVICTSESGFSCT